MNAVTIFENRGEMMGASNPHPHGQIWAQSSIPVHLQKECGTQRDYAARSGKCLLCEYVQQEIREEVRVVHASADFAVVVPFWAVWPFETLVLPRRHIGSLDRLTPAERFALAQALSEITSRYDRLFATPFPYSMGFHQRPTDGEIRDAWHAHAHYYPPLLRSATVRKYMVGYEMLAEAQRDITAEMAAASLRDA